MRSALLLAALLVCGAACAAEDIGALEARLAKDPYDYAARARLLEAYRDARAYSAAYSQAAWLAWFAPSGDPARACGAAYLRDRRSRDRAGAEQRGAAAVALTAVQAEELLYNTCLNGAIAEQTPRLRGEVSELIARAGREEARLRGDPVARAALVRLYLTLDDILAIEGSPDALRARQGLLKDAAARAATVAAWLPDSPGAHRLAGVVRARLADIDPRADMWDLALSECERAHQLDPSDSSLVEMLWVLNLRAGRWERAAHWESTLAAMRGRGAP